MLILSLLASLSLWTIILALIFAAAGCKAAIVTVTVALSAACLVAAWYRYAQVTAWNEIRVARETREYREAQARAKEISEKRDLPLDRSESVMHAGGQAYDAGAGGQAYDAGAGAGLSGYVYVGADVRDVRAWAGRRA